MSYFYFDYETTLIVPGLQAPPPVCMSYAWDDGTPEVLHVRDPRFDLMLFTALYNPLVTIVAHNAPFEFVVTLAHRPDWVDLLFEKLRRGKWQCTMVREKQIRIARGDYREGWGLDDLCTHYGTGIVLDKSNPWRLRYGELLDVPVSEWPKEAIDYSLGDIAVRDVHRKQLASSRPEEYIDHADQMRAAVSLQLTQCRGFATDPERAAALVKATEELLERDKQVLLEHGLARLEKKKGELVVVKNKKAAEQIMIDVCTATGRPVPRGAVTEKMAEKGITEGNVKLDEEACELSGCDVLMSYTRYGQAGTLLSKARRLLNSPIQCSYNVLVATGRTSCRQGDDPKPGQPWMAYGMQIQNQGRDGKTRECFVARPGHCIVSVDYDAFEMRTWAQVCLWVLGYSDLVEILNNPKRCPHIEMGTRLEGGYNPNGATWREQYAYGYDLKAAKENERLKELRGLAKGPNFGLPGHMGGARLVDYCRLNYKVDLKFTVPHPLHTGHVFDDSPIVAAYRKLDLPMPDLDTLVLTGPLAGEYARFVWAQQYREAFPYLEWVKAQIGRQYGSKGQVQHFVSKRLRGHVGLTDAANGYFQGLAADIAKEAGWRLVEEAYALRTSPLYGCRPLAFIHDEWLYEIPRERIHEAGHRMADIMVSTAKEFCPDVLFSAAPAAMYRWSKAAGDPCYNAAGELIPYEEKA